MTLKDILSVKGSTVYSISPDAKLDEAVQELVQHNVGSLVVCRSGAESERPVGIITERDILHFCGSGKCRLEPVIVADVMSVDLVTATPDDKVERIMGVMTKQRLRHLPVMDKDQMVGLVSIGDVVKAEFNRLAMENKFMKDYIQS